MLIISPPPPPPPLLPPLLLPPLLEPLEPPPLDGFMLFNGSSFGLSTFFKAAPARILDNKSPLPALGSPPPIFGAAPLLGGFGAFIGGGGGPEGGGGGPEGGGGGAPPLIAGGPGGGGPEGGAGVDGGAGLSIVGGGPGGGAGLDAFMDGMESEGGVTGEEDTLLGVFGVLGTLRSWRLMDAERVNELLVRLNDPFLGVRVGASSDGGAPLLAPLAAELKSVLDR